MLELYNTTNITRRIPRYNYRGTFVLRPHEAVSILDDQALFFKPYQTIGIVVRKKTVNAPDSGEIKVIEPPKEIVHKELLGSGLLADKQIEVYSAPVEPGEVVEAPIDSLIGPALDTSVDQSSVVTITNGEGTFTVTSTDSESSGSEGTVYTEESLAELSRKQLRDIAASLGIDASTVQRKDDIKDMILGRK